MRLAVIVTEYPKFTETFILRDLMKFIEYGAELRLFHLAPFNRDEMLHDFAAPTRELARHPDPFRTRTLGAALGRSGSVARSAVQIVQRQWGEPVLMAKSLGLTLSASAIAREIADWGADHIHAEFAGHPATAAWVTHRMTGIPYSVSCRAHDIFRTQALLAEKLNGASFVRTVSNYAKSFLLERVPGLDPARMEVIHSSVDVDTIPKLAPCPDTPFHILYVGSLQQRKGVDILLEALAGLTFSDWRCSIVGDGPDRAPLEAQCARLGLSDRVAFLGKQDFHAVSVLYESAHAVAVPSIIGPRGRTEGIPNVAIEGMAFQRPVISTNVSGIPELISDRVTGRLIEPGSVPELIAALTDIREDPAAAQAMAEAGRRHVEAEFSLAINARRQFDLFARHSARTPGVAA